MSPVAPSLWMQKSPVDVTTPFSQHVVNQFSALGLNVHHSFFFSFTLPGECLKGLQDSKAQNSSDVMRHHLRKEEELKSWEVLHGNTAKNKGGQYKRGSL